jgi:hypothetical protein
MIFNRISSQRIWASSKPRISLKTRLRHVTSFPFFVENSGLVRKCKLNLFFMLDIASSVWNHSFESSIGVRGEPLPFSVTARRNWITRGVSAMFSHTSGASLRSDNCMLWKSNFDHRDERHALTTAHLPPGEFVHAKRKTNLGNACDWSAKKFAAKNLNQFLLFYCSREQIRLVENGLKAIFPAQF